MSSTLERQMSSVHKMLNPSSIAVVGATARLQYGGRFLQAALRASDRVRVYPVNPRYEELGGVRCYPSLEALPESPDLVGLIVPYGQVLPLLEECSRVGAGSAIVISAGFAERGLEDRADLQRQVGELVRQSGVRVCGPNCLGVANVKDDIWASASSLGAKALSGPVGLVSQSGASAFGPFLTRAVDKGVGYSYIISTGNEADLDSADFIRYLVDDPDTRVIACFIEGFKDGRKFVEVARLAWERGKPIVVLKVGRSDQGARAARSHTAALTGSDEVHDAVFRQLGVIRVEEYDGLLEMAQLLAHSPAPREEGVAVVSHSGGISSLTADKCGEMGLRLPELRPETKAALDDILQGFGWAANPADVTGRANSDSFPAIMELMANEPEVGTLVVASGGQKSQARQIVELRDSTDRAVAFMSTGSQMPSVGLDLLKAANIPLFYHPEGLARGLKGLVEYHSRRRQVAGGGPPPAGAMSPQQQGEMQRMLALGRRTLTEHESKGFLAQWDIPITRERPAGTWEELMAAVGEVGYPLVLKVDSPDIPHKTEAGLVKVGISNEQELAQGYNEILASARAHYPGAGVGGPGAGDGGGRHRGHSWRVQRPHLRPGAPVRPGGNLRRGLPGRGHAGMPYHQGRRPGDGPGGEGLQAPGGLPGTTTRRPGCHRGRADEDVHPGYAAGGPPG